MAVTYFVHILICVDCYHCRDVRTCNVDHIHLVMAGVAARMLMLVMALCSAVFDAWSLLHLSELQIPTHCVPTSSLVVDTGC